jgi:hypothetical protein
MRRRVDFGCVAFLLAWAPTARVQPGSPALPPALDAQLKALFSGGEFAAQSIGPMAWLDGGRRYTAIPRGSKDIKVCDTATGAGEVLVPASSLTPAGAASPLEVDDYASSGARGKLLVFTNTRRVWRRNTRGDYWVLDTGTRALRKLGGAAPESPLMSAKFSPDGICLELRLSGLSFGLSLNRTTGRAGISDPGMTASAGRSTSSPAAGRLTWPTGLKRIRRRGRRPDGESDR